MTIFVDIIFPVVLLIAIGWGAARGRVLDEVAVKALSDATFTLFMPALLFRAMARTGLGTSTLGVPAVYFGVALSVFFALVVLWRWRGVPLPSAAVRSLGAVFSNNAMLGIPLVRLAFGESGLAILLTIIALHALILLTAATIVLETGRALDPAGADGAPRGSLAASIGGAALSSLVHPVVLPILVGIAWSLLGLPMPGPLDSALGLMGGAATPLCLVLLGASLAQFGLREGLRGAIMATLLKNFLFPAVMYATGRWLIGLDRLTLSVLTVGAALPIGANVYLFAQRYEVELARISAAVSLSTLVGGVTLPLLLLALVP